MILIISTCTHKLHEYEFVKPITDLFEDYKIINYQKLSEEYKTASKIIICGTSLKDMKYLEHISKFDFLKNYSGKVLGICAGAQIIALQNGEKLKDHKEIGMKKIKGKKPLPEEFNAYCLHKKSIELNKEYETLAENEIIQGFKIKNQVGLLFHPEVRNKEMIKEIIR